MSKIREALREVLAITDRNHVAWDRAKAALAEKDETDELRAENARLRLEIGLLESRQMDAVEELRELRRILGVTIETEDELALARWHVKNSKEWTAMLASRAGNPEKPKEAEKVEPPRKVLVDDILPAAWHSDPETDARIDGRDGDELLRDWLRKDHNPLGPAIEGVVAELVRRALAAQGAR